LRRHRSHYLFWRIFVQGLLLIVVVTAVSGAAFHFLGDEPVWIKLHERLGRLVEQDIEKEGGALTARLEEVAFVMDSPVAVYANDGELLASAGGSPPPRFEGDPGEMGDHDWFHAEGQRFVSVRLPSRRAYAVLEPPHKGSPEKLIVALSLLFVVVALMSIPLARAIARPLERITSTARKLGDGDLSARTGVERRDEVGLLARTLDEMAGRLERKLRGEKELLAGASHEIRTPLARIKVALELCDDEGVTLEQLKANLRGIAGDTAELERLVDDALTLARLDLSDGGAESLTLRRAPTPLGALVADSNDRFTSVNPGRILELEVDGSEIDIEVDPALVGRLLYNLLDNAVKYSEADRPIELAARVDGERAVFEVRDRGIGIPEDELEQVFESFHRTDRSRTRGTGGTGLGLALCKRIAVAHGGDIGAASREGGGAIFRVELPAGRPKSPQ
jgi:signal transduction histidine kinase